MPHCCIGVDVIVGFSGESEELFLETYHFLNELDISYLHVFTYSERENTEAALAKDPVPLQERNKRSKMLRILSEKKQRAFYEQHLNKNYSALFENKIEHGKITGHTENYIKVDTNFDPLLVNEIQQVTLVSINEKGNAEVILN